MLALTVSLGVWQLERLRWKLDLLAAIERGEEAQPILLTSAPPPFEKVFASGTFLPGVVRYGAEVRTDAKGAIMGSQVVAVLARPEQEPVVVDLGWAPDGWIGPLPSSPAQVEGYVRAPEHTPRFGTPDDPARRRFFALDPLGIGAALGLPAVAPFTVVALGSSDRIPTPVQTLPRPPNDHLTYAMTWFGLSAALGVIFIIYVYQTLRLGPSRETLS